MRRRKSAAPVSATAVASVTVEPTAHGAIVSARTPDREAVLPAVEAAVAAMDGTIVDRYLCEPCEREGAAWWGYAVVALSRKLPNVLE